MDISFDVIGDLYLSENDSFNWEGKATSLYCVVTGNVSNDTRTFVLTLTHLSKFYSGVFFTTGPYDLKDKTNVDDHIIRLSDAFNQTGRISSLYGNVIILNGVALLGANGWRGNIHRELNDEIKNTADHDLSYMYHSIQKLQKHLDVKKICCVTGCVPGKDLYFGEFPNDVDYEMPLQSALIGDTQRKVSHWLFSGYQKNVDTLIEGVHYVNNPYFKSNKNYYAKRVTIEI